ncbi:MAG: formate--tetrahydrofolate ligase [Fusobacteria bacterium]|nr:formate--tetrahydrofolate ligase [Fusobacteriota bacterium]
MTDIEIASACEMHTIKDIARKAGISKEFLEHYGKYKAKIELTALEQSTHIGELILVTAITPTPTGEGKTTVSIGLSLGLNRLGKKSIVALREPSLGPVFGLKGGATGGGHSQVLPMEDINLHFTGDIHAISSANNLIAAMIDNHLHQGNALNIDTTQIFFKRCMDMNDRALRDVSVGKGGKLNGPEREEKFQISVATEIMAILCLSQSLFELKSRVGRIIFATNLSGEPLYVDDLNASGAVALLLKEAIKPNLVQTTENTPAIIHGGPFANIAHGCNSILATKMAMAYSDYAVTEAGFGSDLGAEKFFDIKCQQMGISPSVVVLVATLRAIHFHGSDNLGEMSHESLIKGFENVRRHIENLKQFDIPIVVALNKFETDTEEHLMLIEKLIRECSVEFSLSTGYKDGGDGCIDLAKKVVKLADMKKRCSFLYSAKSSDLKAKIEIIAHNVYKAAKVEYSELALKKLEIFQKWGYLELPICIAKSQKSFSGVDSEHCCAKDFTMTARDVSLSAGAGFVVVFMGKIIDMPGLPKTPAACGMDVNNGGVISGLS